MSQRIDHNSFLPVYWLAVGTFVIGTEGFMIAGILPRIATDLSVPVTHAGQLVTAFALAYGLLSPVLTAATAALPRRTILIGSLVAFAIFNIAAAFAAGYWSLLAARVLLAMAAGLYVPGANALAGVIVSPAQRGKAIGIVNGGLTLAIALGVPFGTWAANHLTWRATFGGVAMLSLLAVLGICVGVGRDVGVGIPVASLSERFRVVGKGEIFSTLLVTFFWATGAYTVYTYLAVYLQHVTMLRGASIGIVLFVWGLSAGLGVMSGGIGTDRFGSKKVIAPCLTAGALSFVLLGTIAHSVRPDAALVPILMTVILWGVSHWAFYPAQQARLISKGGIAVAPIALSLNASFMYLGFSTGAATGSVVLNTVGVANLGFVGALFVAVSLAAFLVTDTDQSVVPVAG